MSDPFVLKPQNSVINDSVLSGKSYHVLKFSMQLSPNGEFVMISKDKHPLGDCIHCMPLEIKKPEEPQPKLSKICEEDCVSHPVDCHDCEFETRFSLTDTRMPPCSKCKKLHCDGEFCTNGHPYQLHLEEASP